MNENNLFIEQLRLERDGPRLAIIALGMLYEYRPHDQTSLWP